MGELDRFCIPNSDPRFKVILQKKEVDFQTLIGYVGGYIGIFTGFALAQIPDMIFSAVHFGKWWYLSSQNRNKNIQIQTSEMFEQHAH